MLCYRMLYFLLIFGFILLFQFSSIEAAEKTRKSTKRHVLVAPHEKVVPLSPEDLINPELLNERDLSLIKSVNKRVVRKLENDGSEEVAFLDNTSSDDLQEYQGVVGRPGIDFPVLSTIPSTNFNCRKYKSPGYYADLDTNCQVFHICDSGRKISFLCPNGTIFRQSHLICDWWFRVDCKQSEGQYEESAEQLANDQGRYKTKTKASEKVYQTERTLFAEDSPSYKNSESQVLSESQNLGASNVQNLYNQYNKPQGSARYYQSNNNYQQNSNYQNHAPEYRTPAKVEATTPTYSKIPYQTTNLTELLTHSLSSEPTVYTYFENTYEPLVNPTQYTNTENVNTNAAPNVNRFTNTANNYNTNSARYSNNADYSTNSAQTNTGRFSSNTDQYNTNSAQQNQGRYSNAADHSRNSAKTNSRFSNSQTEYINNNNAQSIPAKDFNKNSAPLVQSRFSSPGNNAQSSSGRYSSAADYNRNAGKFNSEKLTNSADYNKKPVQSNSGRISNYKATSPTGFSSTGFSSDITQSSPSSQSSYSNTPTQYTKPTSSRVTNTPTDYSSVNPSLTSSRLTSNSNDFSSSNPSSTSSRLISISNDFSSSNPSTPTQFTNTSTDYSSTATFTASKSTSTPTQANSISSNPSQDYSSSAYSNPTQSTSSILSTSSRSTVSPIDYSSNSFSTNPARFSETTSGFSSSVYSTPTKFTSSPPNFYSSSNSPSTLNEVLNLSPSSSTVYYNPSFTATESPLDTRTAVNFNPLDFDKSNFVPEVINNAAEDTSDVQGLNLLDSLALYYDQINNKESEHLLTSSPDTKNKVSVSELLLRDPPSQDITNQVPANVSNSLPSILTDMTKEGYSYLFSLMQNHSETELLKIKNAYMDLTTDQNQGPVQSFRSTTPSVTIVSSTPATSTTTESQQNLELRHSADLRELAQVFSRALSAYLEDPENFRRILSEVRPTEPNVKVTTANPGKSELLEFSDNTEKLSSEPKGRKLTYTTTQNPLEYSDIASQVNNLIQSTDSGNYYSQSTPQQNLYGGFQNNSVGAYVSHRTTPDSNRLEGTTQTYYSVSPLIDFTRDPYYSTTVYPTTNYIGAHEVNNLVANKNTNDDEILYDKNSIYNSDKNYDYSFGANALKTSQQETDLISNDQEQLVPYDSQSIVSKDNLIKYQKAQKDLYSTLNFDTLEKFSATPQTYQTYTPSSQASFSVTPTYSSETGAFSPSSQADFYSPSSQSSGYTTIKFSPTEPPKITNYPYDPFLQQFENNTAMYEEAKQLFGNLNESSVSTLMSMMHEAESNKTLRRLVLLLVNDKTGKKTAQESRSKLVDALLQMPQIIPNNIPADPISRSTPKIPRRVKVIKSRIPNHDRSSIKYQRETRIINQTPPPNTIQTEPLLQDKLSSESDSRAVELLKSLYVLAAKWG